jgi:hypothetical protein
MQIAHHAFWPNPEGVMTPEQIEALGPAFADYLQQFLFCCGYTQTFDLLGLYCRGLLSDLKRKTCEPLALYSGVAVRTLQEFLRDHRWSSAQVRTQVPQHVAALRAEQPGDDLGCVGLPDETGTVKRGDRLPPLRGAALRGAAAAPDLVLRDAAVRGRPGRRVAGGKTRRGPQSKSAAG